MRSYIIIRHTNYNSELRAVVFNRHIVAGVGFDPIILFRTTVADVYNIIYSDSSSDGVSTVASSSSVVAVPFRWTRAAAASPQSQFNNI